MYNSNGQSTYPQSGPYQQPNSLRPLQQQQQFGPRFQTPSPQFTPPRSFYQPPQQHHDHSRLPYQVPVQPQPFYQSNNPNLNQTPKSSYQSPVQNFETPPNPQYPPPPIGSGFNHLSISPYRIQEQPPIQNFNHPPIQNYNQSPIQNFNDHIPIHNLSQPPPIQNYNPPVTPPFQSMTQNCHQPMTSPYQSPNPGYSPTLNIPFQPQVQSPDSLKQPYQLPVEQCYHQKHSFNLPRHGFNQRPPFRSPGNQRFPFNHQQSRYQQPQQSNNTNRFQFHPRQQYQNYRPRGPPPSFSNHSDMNGSNVSKKDKPQIACEMGDCDFVGHAGAVREHQNLHHRLGLHKKVLYSNNSDAVKNWIEERKKKWPTKETIQMKSEVEDEKNKRGERIADENFNRFNKNNKLNRSGGSKRFNNRKRSRFNDEYVEPVEEPMNGNLKRFAGIADLIKEELANETNKPAALKLLESYDESSDNNQSDNEPPEETSIVKESVPLGDTNLTKSNDELCSTLETEDVSDRYNKDITSLVTEKPNDELCYALETEDVSGGHSKVQLSNALDIDDGEVISTEVKPETSFKVDEECEKTGIERGQKRKKPPKKEYKPIKRMPPLRTPRTEVVEKKIALLEALMGDLMRKERNTITQCICYIRKNMHRFCKVQAS